MRVIAYYAVVSINRRRKLGCIAEHAHPHFSNLWRQATRNLLTDGALCQTEHGENLVISGLLVLSLMISFSIRSGETLFWLLLQVFGQLSNEFSVEVIVTVLGQLVENEPIPYLTLV